MNVLAFHKALRLKDPVLIEIVSVTERGMAVLLHVTATMPRKFQGDWLGVMHQSLENPGPYGAADSGDIAGLKCRV